MKIALVNPNWTFEGSIYFGCRESHLPLEYGYARALLAREGHDVLLLDAQLHEHQLSDVVGGLEARSRPSSDYVSQDAMAVCSAKILMPWDA